MIGKFMASVFLLAMVGQLVFAQTSDAPAVVQDKSPGADANARLDISVLAPEHQLDFWIGQWDVKWEQGAGTNSIRRVLNEKIIEEYFKGKWETNTDYHGKSLTAYDPINKQWKQTWVDIYGDYLLFVGEVKDATFIFSREQMTEGKRVLQRIVFSDIRRNSFTWDWRLSRDDGVTWKSHWLIHYTRKK